MKRTGMPSRAVPMKRTPMRLGGSPAGSAVPASPGPFLKGTGRRATGFSARVKLLVRVRAGSGVIEDAACESCNRWLGRYGGQIQHIIARGMGGTSRPVLSTAANGALLCGLTPQDADGCHFRAESRNALMMARGFWLPQSADPRLEPMTLHSGAVVWRSETGSYLFDPPEASAA
jgi:hypothetical protein